MKTIRLTMISVGETTEKALENLRFDLNEMLRRTGNGGEADLMDYVQIYNNESEVRK